MISRSGNKGFLAAHYEWLALGVGLLALAGGGAFYALSLGEDADEAAAGSVAEVNRMKPAKTGVKPLDMEQMNVALKLTRNPVRTREDDVTESGESFLASERMVRCMNKECAKVISPARDMQKREDGEKAAKCHYCGTWQEEEHKIVLDADGDGIPDKWEIRYKLNPKDPSDAALDSDGDGFTNLEEYEASLAEDPKRALKYDPTDKESHPDYLDSLKIQLPLKETYMPFIFTQATQIPSGWRCEFFFPNRKDSSGYGRKGLSLTAVIGEEIGDSGFVLKEFEKKEAKRAIKGGQGLMKTVDVSEVTVVRKQDAKTMKIVISASKREKPVPVDVQATLVYERGTAKSHDVVPGSEITLSGQKYRIVSVTAVGKGAKVTVQHTVTGKKRVLEALEQ